jgi:hypothetical protein
MTLDNDEMRNSIIRSLIASFKIEKINISETTAFEIYKRVKVKLKKNMKSTLKTKSFNRKVRKDSKPKFAKSLNSME